MNTITVNITLNQLPSSFDNEIISFCEGNYVNTAILKNLIRDN